MSVLVKKAAGSITVLMLLGASLPTAAQTLELERVEGRSLPESTPVEEVDTCFYEEKSEWSTLTEDFSEGKFAEDWEETAGTIVKLQESHVLEYLVKAGENEVTPAKVQLNGKKLRKLAGSAMGAEEVVVEWQEYFAKGYDWPDSGQKLLRFADEEGGPHGGPGINLEIKDDNSTIQLMSYHPPQHENDKDRFTYKNVAFDFGKGRIGGAVEGEWIRYQVAAKLNTPGKSDGYLSLSINDKLAWEAKDLNIRADDTRGFSTFWIGGNYSAGEKKSAKNDSKRYIANIKVMIRKKTCE